MIVKKQPIRTCIVCKEEGTKKGLIRIVKTKEGEISIDTTGKKSGRGAYVCCGTCLEKAIKNKLLSRALRGEVTLECYQKLLEEFSNLGQN